VPDWLSDEWAAAVAALLGYLPGVPGAEGSVCLAVATAPRKDVRVHWRYAAGQVADSGSGPLADADLEITTTAADAAAVIRGEMEPSVAYMRGRLKSSGDGKLLLGFLRSTATPEYEKWRQQVEALGVPPA
jgi:SCP-2 sterol transfer family